MDFGEHICVGLERKRGAGKKNEWEKTIGKKKVK